MDGDSVRVKAYRIKEFEDPLVSKAQTMGPWKEAE